MADDKKVIFSIVNVNKQTPQGKQILKNIYLSFFYGAKIGILGLNGAGKSTVLRIIAGLDEEYDGEVAFSPGYSVGYLPQEPKLDDNKTVMETDAPCEMPRSGNFVRSLASTTASRSCTQASIE